MSTVSEPILPEGATIHPALRLVTWHPRGVLDITLVRRVVRFMEEQEQSGEPFNRFSNLAGLDAVHLTFAEVAKLAQSRVASYHGPKVRTAFLATDSLALGMARMYENLLRHSLIEVGVFSSLGRAAKWLNVPVEVLAPRV